MVSIVGIVILGYLLGTVSFSALVSRRRGVDIRAHGSGNPGTTNVLRVLGWRSAIVVFVGDVGKGALAVLIARTWPVETACPPAAVELGAGLAAVVGHIFPVFSRLRGGKGVATAAGVLLAFDPLWFAIGSLVFVALAWTTRWVAVASLGATLVLALSSLVLRFVGPWQPPWALTVFCAVAAMLIVWAHRDNLIRLAAGTEDKL